MTGFDYSNTDEKEYKPQGYALVPEGTHVGTVEDFYYKKNDKGTGYFKAKVKLESGPYVFPMFVVEHGNAEVEARGRSAFLDFMFATEMQKCKNEELAEKIVGKECMIRVYHGKGQDGDLETKTGDYGRLSDGKTRGNKTLVIGMTPPKKGAQAPAKATGKSAAMDDDVPF